MSISLYDYTSTQIKRPMVTSEKIFRDPKQHSSSRNPPKFLIFDMTMACDSMVLVNGDSIRLDAYTHVALLFLLLEEGQLAKIACSIPNH